MNFHDQHKYENVSSDEESSSEASLRLQNISRPTISRATIIRESIFILFGLAIGLTVAFSINYKEAGLTAELGQCWVYGNNTPIPADVIERVPKVFEPDPRYFGNSEQIDLNWQTLVGKVLGRSFWFMPTHASTIQIPTQSGLGIQKNTVLDRECSLQSSTHYHTPTPQYSRRTFTMSLLYTKSTV